MGWFQDLVGKDNLDQMKRNYQNSNFKKDYTGSMLEGAVNTVSDIGLGIGSAVSNAYATEVRSRDRAEASRASKQAEAERLIMERNSARARSNVEYQNRGLANGQLLNGRNTAEGKVLKQQLVNKDLPLVPQDESMFAVAGLGRKALSSYRPNAQHVGLGRKRIQKLDPIDEADVVNRSNAIEAERRLVNEATAYRNSSLSKAHPDNKRVSSEAWDSAGTSGNEAIAEALVKQELFNRSPGLRGKF